MKLSVERRVQRAHVQLMRSPEFCLLSGVIMCGAVKVEDDARRCPTAYTNGWDVTYGRAFIETLTEPQLNAVIVHENMHKALKQLSMWKKLWDISPKKANMAADYVVNNIIEELDTTHRITQLPDSALIDPMFKGMNTKQVFDLLDKGGGKGKGKGKGKGEGGEPSEGEGGEPMDGHGWEEAEEGSEEGKRREEALDQAIRQGEIIRKKIGEGKGTGSSALDELLRPQVNWREQLREFITSVTSGRDESTWARPSRRGMSRDMYLPSTYSESVGDIVVAIDTSGSIGGKELLAMVSEMVGICEQVSPDKVHLIWWGTSVVGEQVFTKGQYEGMASALKPKDGGGTELSCVFEWVIERRVTPACVVCLTDGCWATPPVPPYPVLFGMTTDTVAPFGKTIRVMD